MINLATAIKSEIAQVANRTLRTEALQLKKATATYEREIAALQRRVEMLERVMERLNAQPAGHRSTRRARAAAAADGPSLRFSAKGFTKLRERLGLSAASMGALIGVTAQSVYKWEDGKARPRAAQLQAIAAIRKLGKREATARLVQLNASGEVPHDAHEASDELH